MRLLAKFLLGIASHGFFISMGFFIGFLVPRINDLMKSHASELPPEFSIYIPLMLLGVLSIFICIGVFIAYLIKNPRFSSNQRLVWILLLAFASALAVPVFFWVIFIRHPNDLPFFGKSSEKSHA
jgi:hypothetical protein